MSAHMISSGRKRANVDTPIGARGPSPFSARSTSLSRAKNAVPQEVNRCLPDSAIPTSPVRAKGRLSESTKYMMPALAITKSGKRRKAIAAVPQMATLDLPISVPPSDIGAGGHRADARKGFDTGASRSNLQLDLDWIKAFYEQRRDLLGTASGLTNRMKALTKSRRGLPVSAKISEAMIAETDYPPLATLLDARGRIREHLKDIERQLETRAVNLPGYRELFEPTKGLGALGLALIIGEAGNLANYSSKSKVWRRFGLHVYEGRAIFTKRSGMSSEDWERVGYCPRRRSIVYQIVDSLVKQQNVYRALRDAQRIREVEKATAEGLTVASAAKIPATRKNEYRSLGHILNRANRYVGKRLLKDLWQVWRREAITALPHGREDNASCPPLPQEIRTCAQTN